MEWKVFLRTIQWRNYFDVKTLLKDVEKLKFEIDKITLVKVRDNYHCDVVARDAKGHRSYKVKLEKNSKFPHFYKIFDIQGQKIISTYQWKGDL